MSRIILIPPAIVLSWICVLLVGCSGSGNDSQVTVLKLTTVLPQGHPSADALEFFEQRLEVESEGRIDVKLFFSGQLGSAVETVELCRGGNIEIINCASSYMTQFLPLLKVLEMPFIFRDGEHQQAVLDGVIGDELEAEIATLDLTVLAFFDAGSRNIMTKEGPIQRPEDLAGMKVRVMPSPLLLSSINAIGASAIPMNQGEVYSALQMGVLDGWENNLPTALNFRMYETGCIHYTRTSHSSIPDLLLMSERSLSRLPSDLQVLVREVAAETQTKQRALWAAADRAAEIELKAAGMIFETVDQRLFQERIEDIYEAMYTRYGDRFRSLCYRIKETK